MMRRTVQVGERDGRWFAWTDDRLVMWFDSESDARHWATMWSYRARPAEAVLVDHGEVREVICTY